MEILVTAFEPFGGEQVNPAQQAAALLPPSIDGARIHTLTVPTVFGKSIDTLWAKAQALKPDIILCLGQAGGQHGLACERVGLNLDDAPIPDNEGNQPQDRLIYPDGPMAILSNLPVKAMVQAIRAAGIPAQLSHSAGTFVCNHLLYGMLYHITRDMPHTRGGFIHVPFTPAQVAGRPRPAPCLSPEDTARGITAALQAALAASETDICAPEGALHGASF